MRKINTLIFYLLFVVSFISAQTTQNVVVIEGHGGLYVMHNQDESIRVIAEQVDGNVLDTTIFEAYEDFKLHYYAADKETEIGRAHV